MSSPKTLTKAIWKSIHHLYATKMEQHVPTKTQGMEVTIIQDNSAGTAYQTEKDGKIIIGFSNKLLKCNETGYSMINFVKRVAWHEFGHAVETTKLQQELGDGDVRAGAERMHREMADAGVPNSVWQVFEDCRLEGLQRKDRSYGLSRFNWPKWQKSMTEKEWTLSAGEMLYEMKMIENGRLALRKLRKHCRDHKVGTRCHTIHKLFFQKLIKLESKATNWPEYLDLMKLWVSEYGTTQMNGLPQMGVATGSAGNGKIPAPYPDGRTPKPDPNGSESEQEGDKEPTPDPKRPDKGGNGGNDPDYIDVHNIPDGVGGMVISVGGVVLK